MSDRTWPCIICNNRSLIPSYRESKHHEIPVLSNPGQTSQEKLWCGGRPPRYIARTPSETRWRSMPFLLEGWSESSDPCQVGLGTILSQLGQSALKEEGIAYLVYWLDKTIKTLFILNHRVIIKMKQRERKNNIQQQWNCYYRSSPCRWCLRAGSSCLHWWSAPCRYLAGSCSVHTWCCMSLKHLCHKRRLLRIYETVASCF